MEALDQMRQPRDAFKLMYQVLQDHCANTVEEEEQYRVPKLTLEQAKKQQSERVEALQQGVRP